MKQRFSIGLAYEQAVRYVLRLIPHTPFGEMVIRFVAGCFAWFISFAIVFGAACLIAMGLNLV